MESVSYKGFVETASAIVGVDEFTCIVIYVRPTETYIAHFL